MSAIEKIVQEAAEVEAEKVDLIYLRDLGKLLLEHEDLKRFFKARMEIHAKQTGFHKGFHAFSTTYEYNMVYVNQGLLNRLRFYIFDIRLWLKTKIKRR